MQSRHRTDFTHRSWRSLGEIELKHRGKSREAEGRQRATARRAWICHWHFKPLPALRCRTDWVLGGCNFSQLRGGQNKTWLTVHFLLPHAAVLEVGSTCLSSAGTTAIEDNDTRIDTHGQTHTHCTQAAAESGHTSTNWREPWWAGKGVSRKNGVCGWVWICESVCVYL